MLPLKEKPHEVSRGHRLNLLAQRADGQAMNAGQKPSMTPLRQPAIVAAARPEPPSQHLALRFESDHRRIYSIRLKP
jgi:hypothetical protein